MQKSLQSEEIVSIKCSIFYTRILHSPYKLMKVLDRIGKVVKLRNLTCNTYHMGRDINKQFWRHFCSVHQKLNMQIIEKNVLTVPLKYCKDHVQAISVFQKYLAGHFYSFYGKWRAELWGNAIRVVF